MRNDIKHLLIAAALVFASHAEADFYLVCNNANPQHTLTKKEAVDLYMGRTRAFSNGDFAVVLDLPQDHAKHAAFFEALTGMGPAQVNSYWSRLMFSGQTMPPTAVASEAAMVSQIRRNPAAVGWLTQEPTDRELRTLLVVKEPR